MKYGLTKPGAIALTWRLTLSALLALSAFGKAPAEEAQVRAERFDGLIEALNASSAGRAKILELIYNELRGPDGREMQETLRQSLSRQNTLILLGVIEAMAMLGDPRDVASLEAFLDTTEKLEVKTQVIRLLPAFCLQSERARFNYITYASGYERVAKPETLEPLRRPPLTRRGRLDMSLERLQGRVTRSIASQFDPVGAALRHVDDLLFGVASRRTVAHYVGNSLGNDPGRWSRLWAAQGGDMALRAPEEVEEIRMAGLVSLSDMGAEGIPEVIEAFGTLFPDGSETLQQSGFDAMSVMCRTGFQGYAALVDMVFSAEDAVEGESWRNRRYASTASLAVYAAETTTRALDGNLDDAVFIGAANCLGAALAYPDGYPDADGVLAEARARGEAFIERLLMRPDISREKRAAAARAIGEIGSVGAMSALYSIISSPYCSPEAGTDGTRMAEAVIDALRNAAIGQHAGSRTARETLLELMNDERVFPALRAQSPPVGLKHMVLWRLQRLARTNDVNLNPEVWRERLGW